MECFCIVDPLTWPNLSSVKRRSLLYKQQMEYHIELNDTHRFPTVCVKAVRMSHRYSKRYKAVPLLYDVVFHHGDVRERVNTVRLLLWRTVELLHRIMSAKWHHNITLLWHHNQSHDSGYHKEAIVLILMLFMELNGQRVQSLLIQQLY